MWALLTVMLHAAPAYQTGPIPGWVEPVEIPTAPVSSAHSVMLLEDVQYRAGGKTSERFEHRAWKVLTLGGVKANAQQQFPWDPSYSSLTIHGVWVWRDGTRRVAWASEDARVLQLESGLDQGIYDGRQTLVVELRDLRVGDVVECAWTVSGNNPVFEGRTAFSQIIGATEPLAWFRLRVLWEGARTLNFEAFGQAPAVLAIPSGNVTNFRVEARDVDPIHFELSVPFDEPQVPWVSFSDWKDWSEVAQWASRIFKTELNGPRFRAELERLKQLPEDRRLEAAVRFVQDDVRYVGVELGAHSHRPHSVEWVLERGFGDCKDKAQLLAALLRGLGVDAAPMLVDTDMGGMLPKRIASHAAFDHAIVKASLAAGPRFIDATETHRRGKLLGLTPPPFRWGLPVDAKSTGLVEMPIVKPDVATYEFKQTWTEGGDGVPASLELVTIGRGPDAALLRRVAMTDDVKEHRRQLREDDFDARLELLSMELQDDEATESVTITERYRVKQFWVVGQHEFRSVMVGRSLPRLDDERTLPLSLDFPAREKEVLIWNSSKELSGFDLAPVTTELPAFEFHSTRTIQGKQLRIEWEYQNLRDRVATDELGAMREGLRRAYGELQFDVFEVRVSGGSDGRGGEPREPLDTDAKIAIILFCVAVVALGVFIINIPRIPGWIRGAKAKLRARRFVDSQKSSPGEVASSPAVVASLEQGRSLFTSRSCPRGHTAWSDITPGEGVRLGDERIHVLTRRCGSCDAREDRYMKVTAPM
ncbi:MAG: DUF3857 domain-containing protein [Archangium sp.]